MSVPRVAFAISTALCLTACDRAKVAGPESPFTEAEERRLRVLLREEIAAVQLQPGTVVTDSKKIRDAVDKLILARLQEEIPKVDWQGKLQDPQVLAMLTQADPKDYGQEALYAYGPRDLSGIPTLKGKIKAVAEGVKGVPYYYPNSSLSQQLQQLGPGSKEALLEALNSPELEGNEQGVKLVYEALNAMLTVEDKDLLIKDLNSEAPRLVEAAHKFRLAEAGPIAIQKLQDAVGKPELSVDHRVALLAMDMDPVQATPLVLDHIGTGRGGVSLAQQIDEYYPEIDITGPLRSAAAMARGSADEYQYAELMLKRGMYEGLALAAEGLLDRNQSAGQMTNSNQVRGAVRRYLNIEGTDAEVAKWILDNRSKLVWNPQNRVFEEKS